MNSEDITVHVYNTFQSEQTLYFHINKHDGNIGIVSVFMRWNLKQMKTTCSVTKLNGSGVNNSRLLDCSRMSRPVLFYYQ